MIYTHFTIYGNIETKPICQWKNSREAEGGG
jgi:hypothetical protein